MALTRDQLELRSSELAELLNTRDQRHRELLEALPAAIYGTDAA